MSETELEHIFDPKTFSPLVLTTKDGFALAIEDSRNVLIGLQMLVVKHSGRIYQIPFHAIAHISEKGEHIG
jgi:hypothetical protein